MKATIKSSPLVYCFKFVVVCVHVFYTHLKRFRSLWMLSLSHKPFIVKYSQCIQVSEH